MALLFSLFLIWPILEFCPDFRAFNHELDNDNDSYKYSVKLDWKTLKTVYHLNKQKWRFEFIVSTDYRVHSLHKCLLYNTDDEWITIYLENRKILPYKNKDKIIRIQLSFIDYIKFLWAKRFSKKRTVGLEMFLDSAQRDVDRMRSQALEQIQEGQRKMSEAIKKKQSIEESNIVLKL